MRDDDNEDDGDDVAHSLLAGNPLETEIDCQRASNEGIRLLAAGLIGVKKADGIHKGIRTTLASIKQRTERSRIDELKQLISRAEALRAEGLQHAQRVRQHREEPKPGVWDVDAWKAALESVGRRPGMRRADGMDDDAED